MNAAVQRRLGMDLSFPEDEILIKTMMRLHRLEAVAKQAHSRWVLVDEGPYDAVICDADSPLGAETAHPNAPHILRIASHGPRKSGINCLPRPISPDALYAWLARLAQALSAPSEAPMACVAPAKSVSEGPELRSAGAALTPAGRVAQGGTQGPSRSRDFPNGAKPQMAQAQAQADGPANGLDPAAYYRLTQWPPAVLLMNEYKNVRMASPLSRHPLRMKDLCNITGASKVQCVRFLTLLMNIQLLQRCSEAQVESALPARTASFLPKAQAVQPQSVGQECGQVRAACAFVVKDGDFTRSERQAQSDAALGANRGLIGGLRKKLGLGF